MEGFDCDDDDQSVDSCTQMNNLNEAMKSNFRDQLRELLAHEEAEEDGSNNK